MGLTRVIPAKRKKTYIATSIQTQHTGFSCYTSWIVTKTANRIGVQIGNNLALYEDGHWLGTTGTNSGHVWSFSFWTASQDQLPAKSNDFFGYEDSPHIEVACVYDRKALWKSCTLAYKLCLHNLLNPLTESTLLSY